MKILKVRIKHEVETDPDLAWLGQYVSEVGPGIIDRRYGRYWESIDYDRDEPTRALAPQECVGFRPANKAWGWQDYLTMEAYEAGEWYMLGTWAEAEVLTTAGVIQHIRSGGLWGIDSRSSLEDATEVRAEQLDQLRTILAEFGISLDGTEAVEEVSE